MKTIITAFLFFCFFQNIIAQAPFTFIEEEGIVVIEAESTSPYGQWAVDTTISSFLGDSYLRFQGTNQFNNPGTSRLVYKIQINKTGRYRFQWRSRITVGSSNTDNNDSWLRFNDASDFYGQKGNEIVYPRGTGKTPNPEGSSSNGWFKIYQNRLNSWTWNTSTSDNDPHNIFVEFDSAGVYTVEISGRSNGHGIDRFVLYHSDVSTGVATSLTRPESPRLAVSTKDRTFINLNIFPNPVNDLLTIAIPNTGPQLILSLINIEGKIIKTNHYEALANDLINLPVNDLAAGTYFIIIEDKQKTYRGEFIKL